MNFTLLLAKRFLLGSSQQGQRSGVLITAMLGIFFASAFVLVSIGILAGFQNTYRRAILDFNTHIIIKTDQGFIPEDQIYVLQVLEGLQKRFPHEVSPYLFYETLMPTSKGMRPIILKGIAAAKMKELYPFQFDVLKDQSSNNQSHTWVGSGVADLQTQLRDTTSLKLLTFISGQNGSTRYENMPVAGVFKSGLYSFDSQFVLMDIADLRAKYFEHENVNGFEVRLKDFNQVNDMAHALRGILGEHMVTTWDELNANLLDALKLERTTFFSIAFLILMIASLNVFGFNFLFFLTRKREFLILSLLGLSQRDLRSLLRVLSFAVGVVSTFFAAIFSYAVLWFLAEGPGIKLNPSVYFVEKVPVLFEMEWFLIFVIGTWILCLLTSWLAGRVVLKRHLASGNLSF